MDFYKRARIVCLAIPYGEAATYGQIAMLCGKPKNARQVGYALNRRQTRGRDPGSPYSKCPGDFKRGRCICDRRHAAETAGSGRDRSILDTGRLAGGSEAVRLEKYYGRSAGVPGDL